MDLKDYMYMEKECAYCGKTFRPHAGNQFFCSRECWNNSKKKNEEVKCPTCGKIFIKVGNTIYCDKCRSKYTYYERKKIVDLRRSAH